MIARLEGSDKPVAAAIHGVALGGGFEIALACHMRVADRGARIGLPEVRLGILPGAGGTVRTTWLAGAEAALALAGSGDPVTAEAGRQMGLIDHVVGGDVAAQAADLLRRALDAHAVPVAVRARAPRRPPPVRWRRAARR